MRICVFNWKDPGHPAAGGAETYTAEVTRRWAAAGHRVTVFAAAYPGAAALERTPDGVRIIRRGDRLGVFAAARRWFRDCGEEFDLVLDEVNVRPFGCARWRPDLPVVALVHQVAREIWSAHYAAPIAWAGRWVLEPRWLRTLRDVPVLTVSASSRDSLRDYGLTDVTVVPEGIARRARPDVPRATRPTLIVLGRLAPNKRVHEALAAFARLKQTMPEACMWVVGDGPEYRRLLRSAPSDVTFFGRVPDAMRDELLARAHAQVITSLREGWALVVDEAAAIGTPTLAYRRPGLCDSVPAARGVLVDPDPAALADGLAAHLPAWYAAPAQQGWAGGAVPWDEVAATVLARCSALVGAGAKAGDRARADIAAGVGVGVGAGVEVRAGVAAGVEVRAGVAAGAEVRAGVAAGAGVGIESRLGAEAGAPAGIGAAAEARAGAVVETGVGVGAAAEARANIGVGPGVGSGDLVAPRRGDLRSAADRVELLR